MSPAQYELRALMLPGIRAIARQVGKDEMWLQYWWEGAACASIAGIPEMEELERSCRQYLLGQASEEGGDKSGGVSTTAHPTPEDGMMAAPAVTFTERPDILITAECQGITRSWLRGDDDDAETERQKQVAAHELQREVAERAVRGRRMT